MTELLAGRRFVALTGAGCSTESGIPDYRGAGRPQRNPIQHDAFMRRAEVRQRYWARATLGWERFKSARPNAAHAALARLEAAGLLAGVITQNVDRLHHAAGSRRVVELHGALDDVRCLACAGHEPRAALQARLLAANPDWLHAARGAARPDGDAELPPELVATFQVVGCRACGGALKPDVVFFGGAVAEPTLSAAWSLLGAGTALLVVGSSLTVYSGFRFVRRAHELAMPVAIVNVGPTRGDALAHVRVSAPVGEVLPRLADALDRPAI
ncbi:MAG TPA: NAD-dependent protein deacetylase [Polyangia bacterium]|nr:NAD-dependent protein deacetylase [Polyangia bacterium]